MKTTTHTPGPWAFAVSGTAFSITADADPVYVGYVEIPDRMSKVPLAEANARLIAAAPELLAALIQVVAVADRKTVEFDAARAAIAKATGEAK